MEFNMLSKRPDRTNSNPVEIAESSNAQESDNNIDANLQLPSEAEVVSGSVHQSVESRTVAHKNHGRICFRWRRRQSRLF